MIANPTDDKLFELTAIHNVQASAIDALEAVRLLRYDLYHGDSPDLPQLAKELDFAHDPTLRDEHLARVRADAEVLMKKLTDWGERFGDGTTATAAAKPALRPVQIANEFSVANSMEWAMCDAINALHGLMNDLLTELTDSRATEREYPPRERREHFREVMASVQELLALLDEWEGRFVTHRASSPDVTLN